jgi:tripartite-type tricarboxylate transporter receptor subunit TctC
MSLFARSFYFGIQIDNIEGKLESIVSHLDLNVNNIAAHERFALAYDLPSLKDQGIT